MFSIIVLTWIAFDSHAHAEDRVVMHSGVIRDSRDQFADKLLDFLFERAPKATPLHHADLDGTTLGKTGYLSISGYASPHAILRPLLPRRADSHSTPSFGSTSPLVGYQPQMTRRVTPSYNSVSPVRSNSNRVQPTPRQSHQAKENEEVDIVVIGSGIGGLSAAAMLSKYGYKVVVCEAHYAPGGAAHEWVHKVKDVGTFKFDSGPSLFSGMSSPSANPLRQVLDAVGHAPEWLSYNIWDIHFPDGKVFHVPSGDVDSFRRELVRVSGEATEGKIWDGLLEANNGVAKVISSVPPIALRADLGAAQTLLPYVARLGPIAPIAMFARGLDPSGPFSKVLDAGGVPKESLTYWFFDFLSFALQGQLATTTPTGGPAFMMREFFAPGAVLDYPRGGSGALVQALVRAIESRGGEVRLRTRVEELIVNKDGRVSGVVLQGGSRLHARNAVVSNADVWCTSKLVPSEWSGKERVKGTVLDASETPMTPSFMHLHLGFKTEGLDLGSMALHHIVVNDRHAPVDQRDNCVFISIPSVLDDTAAPSGFATLHAYLPATEPYDEWEGLDRRSEEYKLKKIQRAEPLWRAVERVIPDIRSRVVTEHVGSPLTHERFLNRARGTYGPAWVAGQDPYPSPQTPLQGLWCVGDGSFPGIGVPAVAGNGAGVANTIASVEKHVALLDELRSKDLLVPDRDWAK